MDRCQRSPGQLQHPPPQQQLPPFHNRLSPHSSRAGNHLYRLSQWILTCWEAQAQHKFLARAQSEFALPERSVYQVCLFTYMFHQGGYFLPEVAIVDRAFTEGKGHFLSWSIFGKISG